MSDNVGLSTPRGSGTSGYVQRNLALLKPRDRTAPYPKDLDSLRHRQRQPDKSILEHDRKRDVEVKVFELRDKLEEEDKTDEAEIDRQCDNLRSKLLAELARGAGGPGPKRNIKSHQVHELAEAKIQESERLRKALRISKDYEEGGHWRRQEDRMKKAVAMDEEGGVRQEGGKEEGQDRTEKRNGRERQREKTRRGVDVVGEDRGGGERQGGWDRMDGNAGGEGDGGRGGMEDKRVDRRYWERERSRSYSRSMSRSGSRSRSRSRSRSPRGRSLSRGRTRSRSRSRNEDYDRGRD